MPGSPETNTTWPLPLWSTPSGATANRSPRRADQRVQHRSAQSLKPASDIARAERLPSRHRRGDALEFDLAEISVFEQVAGQPAGARSDHDCVGLGQGLQARREIGRIAGDIVLDNLAADDNQSGGDPEPRVELFGLIQL